MLEVHDGRPEAPQRPRDGKRHPQLLKARTQLDGLDAVGDEVGTAREGGEAKRALAHRGQTAEEILDVGLVSGSPAAEHIRVENDKRRHDAASS